MLKVLELFSGYGSQALALENLGIEFTSDISEIDKYAIQAYNQLHGETHNWGDITKIDEKQLPHYDLITYSSPCQDFSVAGLGKGGDTGSGTRSSLLWECERIIRAVKPKYLLMENVKNLVGEKHKHNFIRWLHVLEMMGYQNYWKVLNAKDYGVPQNRERVFVVSILGCEQYLFPNPIKLEKRLKDILESDVDDKYYLSDKTINMFLRRNELNRATGNGFKFETADTNGYASAITTRAGARADDNFIQEPLVVASRGREKGQELELNETGCSNTLTSVQKDNYLLEPQVKFLGNCLYPDKNYGTNFAGATYDSEGLMCTLNTQQGGNRVPYINEPLYIREATQKGYAEAYDGDSVTLDEPNSQTRRGRVGKQMSNTLTTSCNIGVVQVGNIVHTGNWDNPERGRIYSDEGVSPALSTMQGGGLEPKILSFGNYMPSGHSASKIVDSNGLAPTVMENHGTVTATNVNYRIRKLTPRECWRLMGVKDEQFDKLHDLSNTQLYKLAGNSIVVDVLMGIFKNLLLSDEETTGQLRLI